MDFTQIGTPVKVGSKYFFTEAPTWDKVNNVFLFSDRDGNKLYKLVLPNTVTVYRNPGYNTYSMLFDKAGNLITAEAGSHSVVRTLADGTREVLAEKWDNKTLNAPNKMVMRDDGTIYFTDPIFGEAPTNPLGYTGLYRISPTGELFLEGKFTTPNGLGLSLDQKTLYMASTTFNQVMTFTVAADGSTSNGKNFLSVQMCEGVMLDPAGNIWVTGKDSIYIYSPEGQQLSTIKIPARPTSMAIGGTDSKTLLVTTDSGSVYTVALP